MDKLTDYLSHAVLLALVLGVVVCFIDVSHRLGTWHAGGSMAPAALASAPRACPGPSAPGRLPRAV